eukprot:TRINITY_DN93200_c0_g1_i1.p1 TRINITY_DN93200_c0_g1~~TRINITY_DN93200_c0_g1_i1.p1  ORF type:complete len:239 (+),score=46.22 TRINITY_DN93200_c0_g1_i1:1092-1808(+)
MKGRSYFADSCSEKDSYDPRKYASIKLLGKRFSYTTDISGTGCGCNAAVYFTSMHQARDASKCHDYYCDAAGVCGSNCVEIDIQESNMFAYRATLHAKDDLVGMGTGYGGWAPHKSVWSKNEYGPQGSCIQTSKSFRVAVDFPVIESSSGRILKEMIVTLSQQSCNISLTVSGYSRISEVTEALKDGMTPIISYWKSANMTWMDGKDADGAGPCDLKGEGSQCKEHVRFHSFQIEDLK